MLSEEVGNREKGQVALVLEQTGTHIFNMLYADLMQKSFSLVKSEKLVHGRLRNYTRKSQTRDFSEFSASKIYDLKTLQPSGKFSIYTTDMNDSGNFLQYEGTGVQPDVFLKPDSDWIDQLKTIINSKATLRQ